MGPESSAWCLSKRKERGDLETEASRGDAGMTPCEDGGRDQRDVSTCRGEYAR